MLERALPASILGAITAATGPTSDASVLVSIIVFAAGIIVGMACVLASHIVVRRRLASDFDAWVAAGRPERRVEERGRARRRRGD